MGHDTVINGRAADRVAATSRSESSHGRASLQRRPALLWWKQSRSSQCCKLKGVKTQQGQKSKSGLLFLLPLLWGLRKAQWDFLNTASERKLDFHRPADPLRAGVSQIQFQTSFLSFQCTSQLTIPPPGPSAYQDLNKSQSKVQGNFPFFFFSLKNPAVYERTATPVTGTGMGNITWKLTSVTQVDQICFFFTLT